MIAPFGAMQPLSSMRHPHSPTCVVVVLSVLATIAVGLLLPLALVEWGSVRVPLLIATCATLLVALLLSRVPSSMPRVFRPAVIVAAGTSLATGLGLGLQDAQIDDYAPLRYWELAGIAVGTVFATALPPFPERRPVPRVRLAELVWWSGAVASVAFFAWKGIPLLGGEVESSRVSVASTGTGYLRLAGYLTAPAAAVLFATRHPRRWHFVLGSALIILGLANRSPLLYLFAPIVFVGAFGSGDQRRRLSRLVVPVVTVGIMVVAIGAYRIVSEREFRNYAEYRHSIEEANYAEVAWTSVQHYAEVVARNAVLTKELADDGALDLKYGATYLTPILTALPGEQLSLDRQIRVASGAEYVGGGTPPTLAGEGYVNFGYAGTFLAPLFLILGLRYIGDQLMWSEKASEGHHDELSRRVRSAQYGYLALLGASSQVAGVAGASTFPLTGMVLLILLVGRTRGDD